MKVIDEIQKRLSKYPQAKYNINGNKITVFPATESGFAVSCVDNYSKYTVFFGSWHEEYHDAEEALNVFAFGLSEDCRLAVTYRGKYAFAWTVEGIENSEWVPCDWVGSHTTGLFIPRLMPNQQRTVYLQNSLLKSDS